MDKENKKKTFWPYGIMLSIFAIIVACVYTIIFSLDYPVYSDDYYLDKYQRVDHEYNEIQISQEQFEKKYDVKLLNKEHKVGEKFNITLEITPKNGENFGEISSEIKITRPLDGAYDQKLTSNFKDGLITTNSLSVSQLGRWQVLAKIKDGDKIGFYKFEFIAL